MPDADAGSSKPQNPGSTPSHPPSPKMCEHPVRLFQVSTLSACFKFVISRYVLNMFLKTYPHSYRQMAGFMVCDAPRDAWTAMQLVIYVKIKGRPPGPGDLCTPTHPAPCTGDNAMLASTSAHLCVSTLADLTERVGCDTIEKQQ